MSDEPNDDKRIAIKPPKKCPACKRSQEVLKQKYGRAFMYFGMPNTPLQFYQYPACHCLVGNVNQHLIIKAIREQQDKPKLLKPQGGLILDPNFKPILN